jgi:hypothetical protein
MFISVMLFNYGYYMTFLNLNSNVYFCYFLQLWILHDFPEFKQQCVFLLLSSTMDINMTFLNLNSNVYFCYSLQLWILHDFPEFKQQCLFLLFSSTMDIT